MSLNHIALATMLAAQLGVVAPRGHRFPTETDFKDDWKLARAERPTPFLVKADFNGDTLPDEAWLLPEVSSPGWALFVFLGSSKGAARVIRLERDSKTEVQGWGIDLVEPGDHQTACGKGYLGLQAGRTRIAEIEIAVDRVFQIRKCQLDILVGHTEQKIQADLD